MLIRKLNQAGYDCIFLQGPHVLPATSTFDLATDHLTVTHETNDPRAWFLFDTQNPSNATRSQSTEPVTFVGLDESLELVKDELQRIVDPDTTISTAHPPLTAIFGFSQGAVVGHILALLAQRQSQHFGTLDAVVLASGLAAQHDPTNTSRYDTGRLTDREPIRLPSLHLIGRQDGFVEPSRSLDLAQIFEQPRVVWHDKGHVVSQTSAICQEVVAFLEACRSAKMKF